jgi:hypothetical protein
MPRTCGTRSAYNAGCRCDECKEASRSARARQRSADDTWARDPRFPDLSSVEQERMGVTSSPGLSGVAGSLLGVGVAGVGGYALWHGLRMQPGPDTAPAAFRRIRRRWCVGGTALVVAGVGIFVYARS